MLVAQLDFGDDQAEVVAGEHIDFPGEIAARDDVAHLLDDGALAELHQRLGFQHRNIILQLQPAQVRGARFDGERCSAAVLDANADRYFPRCWPNRLVEGTCDGWRAFPNRCHARGISAQSRNSFAPLDRAVIATCGLWMMTGKKRIVTDS